MKYASQYLQAATRIINDYNGTMPLQHFLKSTFAANKKYGSKDRKFIAHLCYSYFRLGHVLKEIPLDERIIIVLFVTGQNDWDVLFPEEWKLANTDLPNRLHKIELKYPAFEINDIFPFKTLSASVDAHPFALSHLHQPNFFIRIRPGKEKFVKEALEENSIEYAAISSHCYAMQNATKLNGVLQVNKDYVVQDYNSQRVGEMMAISAKK